MPPEAISRLGSAWPAALAVPPAWRMPLAGLAAAWIMLIAMFLPDWRDMAALWWNISTYNHILLIPALVAWLVALRAPELAKLTPQAWWPGLVLVGLALLLWVAGSFAGLSLARQLGAVAMLQGAALALLGPRVGWGLAFPLGYMLFLVPVGEELVPMLQIFTAKMTMGLLDISGVPAMIEGVFITTAFGYFKVAEACSGVKFLIAMIAFGALVANVCFRSPQRRAAFMAVAIAVPVLANGLRAWGTIFISKYQGVEFAAGFDHVFYGWVFFALVIVLVLALGWRWFDREIDDPMIDAAGIGAAPRLAFRPVRREVVLAAVALLSLAALGWSAAAGRLAAPLPARIALPEVPGWTRIDYAPQVWWQPRHGGADHRLLGRYANVAGDTVDVSYALYAGQSEGREAGGYGEGALMPETSWAWAEPGPALAGGKVDRLAAAGKSERVAATWYRNGGLTTGSNAKLKLANAADLLLLRAQPTAVLILSAEERPGHPAPRSLRQFLTATGSSAGGPGPWMDRIGQGG